MIFRPQPSLKLEWDSIYSILDQDLLSNIYAPAFTLVINKVSWKCFFSSSEIKLTPTQFDMRLKLLRRQTQYTFDYKYGIHT